MATEILNEGATSFEDGNWSNDGIDAADDMIVDKRFGPINAGLDWSAIVGGVESFEFTAGAEGVVGAANTPLIIDADNSADAFVRVLGNVTMWLQAGGDSSLINNVHVDRGTTYLTGGTFSYLSVSGGEVIIEAAAVVTDILVSGGRVHRKYNATVTNSWIQTGGTIENESGYTSATQSGGMFRDDRELGSATTYNQWGGTRVPIRGDTANDNAYSGVLENRQAKEAIVLGASSGVSAATLQIRRSDKVDVSALARPNAYQTADPGI